MKIKANICISRDSNDVMRLKVQDEASHETFLELGISAHDLMMALTGLAYVDAKGAEVRALDVVGKHRVTENRSAEYPGGRFDRRDAMTKWLVENCAEDGWTINPYLGSQSSISRRGDSTILNYSVYRFEDRAPAQEPGEQQGPSSEKGGEDIPDECVATGQTCSYGPHGRRGEMQCIYCGAASSSAAGKEGGE